MNRLTRYLIGLFSAEAGGLLAVALSLVFLVECLRIIDTGAVRGQELVMLFEQVLLALPSTGMGFVYVCIVIGLARALRTLQSTRELHILHVSQQLPGLLRAVAIYAGVGTVLMLLLSHVVEPAAQNERNLIRTRAAADLVGRSLVPNRFAEITDGVTVTVGGRRANGEITSFFADDRRAPTRRTYIAESALITADELGYVLQLQDGTIQYRTPEGTFSEVAFGRYDLALERLTGASEDEARKDNGSLAMLAAGLSDGFTPEQLYRLSDRTVQGVRVIALCLFVVAIAAFPSGRRREPLLPIEIVVLLVAFLERLVGTYGPRAGWLPPALGVIVLTVASLVILGVRLWWPPPRPVRAQP